MISKSKKEQIKINLELLDFDVIHNTMKHLGLKWKDVNTGERRVPNKKEIAAIAQKCMESAFENEVTGISQMGGFYAEVIEGIVEIKFVLTQASPLSKLLS